MKDSDCIVMGDDGKWVFSNAYKDILDNGVRKVLEREYEKDELESFDILGQRD